VLRNLVDLVRAYSNRGDLSDDLSQAVSRLRSALAKPSSERPSVRSVNPPRIRLLTDRLADEDASKLVRHYEGGSTIRELANQFSISTTSVKKLLRHGGAAKKRKPRDA
jgi:DNA-directed RNA polymerase specialized sigma24 family protein